MAQSLASLNVRLTLEAEDYRRRLDQANAQIAAFGRDNQRALNNAGRSWNRLERTQNNAVNSMRDGVKRLAVGLAALASVNALKGMITDAVDAANAADDFSVRIGITVEELSKLEFAAASSGIQINAFRTSMQRMVRRSSEASEGLGVAVKAFDSLNLSAKDMAKLAPDMQLRAIAEAMRGVSDQGERLKIAVQIFDTEGAAMLQMVDNLEAMRNEAEDLGLVMSTDVAKSGTAFNAQLVKMNFLWDAIARTVSFRMLPALNDALASAAKFVGWLNKKIDTTKSVESLEELRDSYAQMVAMAKPTDFLFVGGWRKRVDELNEEIKETIALKKLLAVPSKGSEIPSIDDSESIVPKDAKPDTGKDIEGEAMRKRMEKANENDAKIWENKQAASERALDSLLSQLDGEEEALNASMARRLELLETYGKGVVDKDKKIADLRSAIFAKNAKDQEAIEKKTLEAKLSAGSQFAGNIAAIAESESGKSIEVQRAAGIVQATIAGYVGASKAYADPGGPAGLVLAASIAGLTAVNIAKIAGARASGGPVSAGKTYLVGEQGPELFTSQTSGNITSNSALGGGNTTVNIIEDASKAGQVEQQGQDISVFVSSALNATMDTLHNELNSGKGIFANMEQRYGLSR